jgi:hypothetical protein
MRPKLCTATEMNSRLQPLVIVVKSISSSKSLVSNTVYVSIQDMGSCRFPHELNLDEKKTWTKGKH